LGTVSENGGANNAILRVALDKDGGPARVESRAYNNRRVQQQGKENRPVGGASPYQLVKPDAKDAPAGPKSRARADGRKPIIGGKTAGQVLAEEECP
jgi:hypothetical protein